MTQLKLFILLIFSMIGCSATPISEPTTNKAISISDTAIPPTVISTFIEPTFRYPKADDYIRSDDITLKGINDYYDALLLHRKSIDLTLSRLSSVYSIEASAHIRPCELPQLSLVEVPSIPTLGGYSDEQVVDALISHISELRARLANINGSISLYNQSKALILVECYRGE